MRTSQRSFYKIFAVIALTALALSGTNSRSSPVPDDVMAVEGTASKDGQFCVGQKRTVDQQFYRFIDCSSKQELGRVFPENQEGEISNVHMLSSWSKDNTRVALLVYYGTKLNEVLVFARNTSGAFEPVEFEWPDSVSVWERKNKTKWNLRYATGYGENSLGPWISENTIRLIAGEAKESDGAVRYILAPFRLVVRGKRGYVRDIKVLGVLSDQEANGYLHKWGEKFWRLPEDRQ